MNTQDILDLQDLYARYCWALDCGDADGVAALFTADGSFRLAEGPGAHGRDEIRKLIEGVVASPESPGCQHHSSQMRFAGEGTQDSKDRASLRFYAATLRWNPETGEKTIRQYSDYLIKCARVNGSWFFRDRFHRNWIEAALKEERPFPTTAETARPKNKMSVEDRLAVQDLHARFAWAVDCGDSDAFADCFAPDGTMRVRDQVHKGRDAIARFGEALAARPDWSGSQHVNSQFRIEGQGTSCGANCYYAKWRFDPATGTKSVASLGYYMSRCAKIDGIWYFTDRLAAAWVDDKAPWKGGFARWGTPS